jgi:GMP synthase (glutamine-hydrolysing)
MNPATVAVIDLGSQYTQLIARRVREQQVHSLIFGPRVSADTLREHHLVGIILSGGPGSTYATDGPRIAPELLELNVPVLGICYGMQLLCSMLGGQVRGVAQREYGRVGLEVTAEHPLFAHLPRATNVWMSHGDIVAEVSDEFVSMARTRTCPIAAVRHIDRPVFGLQFHPEVAHTPCGARIFRNFLAEICRAPMNWSMGNVAADAIERIRDRVGEDERVICGLSGGWTAAWRRR